MKNRIWIIFLIGVILVTSLSACQKSASKAPIATPTTNSNLPFPTPLPSSAIGNVLASTQTAQALGNPTSVVVATATTAPITGKTTAPTTAASTATPVRPTATNVVPTTIVVPSATPGRPATYTLHQGEFPFCIARRFNVNAGDLLAINGLNLNSHPVTGTVLTIPQTGTWSSGPRALLSHPTTYTVNAGDSIYSIACIFGDVDPNAIITANALQSPYTLTAGQVLNIP
jgi:LysM repeat protein